MEQETIETKAAFARRIGVDRSWVTRAAQNGRLVLTGTGRKQRVVVEKSLARMDATRGARFDVEDRWSRERGEVRKSIDVVSSSDEGLDHDEIGRRTRIAQMRKEEAEAARRQRELMELTGELVRKDDVRRAVMEAIAVILSGIENIPDRLAPQVAGIEELDRVRARIKDELDGYCASVSAELGRVIQERGSAAA